MARVGVFLVALGVLLAVGLAILAVSGRPVGLGTFSGDVNGELVMLDAALFGLGSGVLAGWPPRRMADRYARASWAVFCLGFMAVVASGLEALRLHGSDPLGDWPAVLLGLAGLVLIPIGGLLVVVALLWAAVGGRRVA
jgi:hypothetical protein